MNGQLATSYSNQAKNITSELRVLEFGYWLDGFGNNTPVYTQQNVPVSFDSKSFQSQVSENVRQYIGPVSYTHLRAHET